jgi:hypothetical protein
MRAGPLVAILLITGVTGYKDEIIPRARCRSISGDARRKRGSFLPRAEKMTRAAHVEILRPALLT